MEKVFKECSSKLRKAPILMRTFTTDNGGPGLKKRILYGNEPRRKMLAGATQVAKCVSATLGPGGRLVMLSTSPNSEEDLTSVLGIGPP